MLFEIGFQSNEYERVSYVGCDLMLFEIGFQYTAREAHGREVVI